MSFKKEYAELLVEVNNKQEEHLKSLQDLNELSELESYKKEMIGKSLSFSEETKSFLSNQFIELDRHIEDVKQSKGNIITKENMEELNDEFTDRYLEISKKYKQQDVAFELTSTYPGGTETFRKIVKEMNENGANIDYIYDKHRGRKGSDDFNGYDSKLMVIMPTSDYAEFNNKIHEDQVDSRMEVIGKRRECFFMNHIAESPSLDSIKKEAKKVIESEKNYGISIFNSYSALGYSELFGSNYESDNKIKSGVKEYLSQINAIEREGLDENNIYVHKTKNLMTSALSYSRETKNEELRGKRVTPLREINRSGLCEPKKENKRKRKMN